MTNDIKSNDRPQKAADATAPTAEAGATTAAVERASGTGEGSCNSPQGQPDQIPAAYSASEGQQIDAIEEFKINCLASALYHEDRERFFAWLHRMAMFVVVSSGTAALSPLKNDYPHLIPTITTLAGLIDLVFDVSGKARLHAALRKQVYSVLAEADGCNSLPELQRRLTLIYADEPPCMYAVSALAYNRSMISFGRPPKFLLDIGWKANLVRHFWPFTSSTFKSFDELESLIH